MPDWNTDPSFTHLACADTGNIHISVPYSVATAGANSWGLQGRTFSPPPDGPIDWQRYQTSSRGLYMYGKEERGRLGFVRCIQGNVWNNQVPWHIPAPVALHGRTLMVGVEFTNDTSAFGRGNRAWVMHAINVWISSPTFPVAGGDRNHKKPLVLDLAFYQSALSGSGLHSHESAVAYHFQESVGTTRAGQSMSYSFNLSQYIDRALNNWATLRGTTDAMLYQLEFVIELKNAEGAARLSNFRLQY